VIVRTGLAVPRSKALSACAVSRATGDKHFGGSLRKLANGFKLSTALGSG
jgi:hypothetical protein